MAQCISPFYKKDTGMSFPCGKCYPCKARRVSGWSFRLLQEAKRSESALFVTLTYSNDTVPITKKGYMSLEKTDVQKFMKRLRKASPPETKIKYYCAGEYGGKTNRPHYHLIMFNAEYQHIEQAWQLGEIHYGTLTAASAAYTLKYISKDGMVHHANDDRQREFSLMSKRLGDNYLSPENIAWHRRRDKNVPISERFCLSVHNLKIAIPRYYKQKIWNPLELQLIGAQFIEHQDKNYAENNPYEKLANDKKADDLRLYYSSLNGDTRHTTL